MSVEIKCEEIGCGDIVEADEIICPTHVGLKIEEAKEGAYAEGKKEGYEQGFDEGQIEQKNN